MIGRRPGSIAIGTCAVCLEGLLFGLRVLPLLLPYRYPDKELFLPDPESGVPRLAGELHGSLEPAVRCMSRALIGALMNGIQ